MSFKTEHRMGVPAPSTVIWEVLSDLDRWPEWNPLYPKIAGTLRIGQKLEAAESLERDDFSGAQFFGGAAQRDIAGREHVAVRVPELDLRTASRTRIGLGVKPAVRGIVIFLLAERAHLKLLH